MSARPTARRNRSVRISQLAHAAHKTIPGDEDEDKESEAEDDCQQEEPAKTGKRLTRAAAIQVFRVHAIKKKNKKNKKNKTQKSVQRALAAKKRVQESQKKVCSRIL